jgi:hypothetical protein
MVFNCRSLEKLREVLEPEGEVIPGVLVTVKEDDDADAMVDHRLVLKRRLEHTTHGERNVSVSRMVTRHLDCFTSATSCSSEISSRFCRSKKVVKVFIRSSANQSAIEIALSSVPGAAVQWREALSMQ